MRGNDGDCRDSCCTNGDEIERFHKNRSSQRRVDSVELSIQKTIELRPDFVFLRAGDMAKRAFFLSLDGCCQSLWLMMVEIEVSPASGRRKALRILDRHISTVEGPRKIPAPRGLRSRTVGLLPGLC